MPEKYLTAKELSAALKEQGVDVSVPYVLRILRAGVPRIRNCAKLSAVMAFLEKNPDFKPWAKELAPAR